MREMCLRDIVPVPYMHVFWSNKGYYGIMWDDGSSSRWSFATQGGEVMTDTVAWQSMLNQVREERDALAVELAAAKAIIAKDDNTESYRCSECGAWHVRKPTQVRREKP